MRVVHIAPLLFGAEGIHGGAERYAYELAFAMSTRHETTLVSFGKESRSYRDDALQVEIIKPAAYPRQAALKTKTNPLSVLPLIRCLREAEAVFCHQQKVLVSTISGAWCRTRRIPVYAIPLGGARWDLSSYVSTDRLFNGILHISGFSRTLHGHEHEPWAHVIYAGVSRDRFFPDQSVQRDGSVLFVGRLLPHKGIDVLVAALPADMPCVIAGTPKGAEYYEHLQRLAEGKNVRFAERIDDAALRLLYQRALCVVLPSVHTDMYGNHVPWTELLGQTVLEGMACGTPAVATNVAAFPEIIEDGRTGLLVPERDEKALREVLVRLRDEPGLAGELGLEGLRAVRHRFSWEAVMDRCEAIIDADRGPRRRDRQSKRVFDPEAGE